jgi:hypothetical protein
VIAVAYLGVSAFLFGCAKFATLNEPAPAHEHGAVPEPAE